MILLPIYGSDKGNHIGSEKLAGKSNYFHLSPPGAYAHPSPAYLRVTGSARIASRRLTLPGEVNAHERQANDADGRTGMEMPGKGGEDSGADRAVALLVPWMAERVASLQASLYVCILRVMDSVSQFSNLMQTHRT